MFPFLIRQGDIVIATFPAMLMLASLAATLYGYFRAPSKGLSQAVVLDLGIIGTVAALVGGRLFHVIFENPSKYWENPSLIFHVWGGGFVSYGAVAFMGLSWYIYLKIRGLNLWKYTDLAVFAAPIIIFFVRIGCLGAGCCYGKPTNFFIHLTFTNPFSDAGRDFPGVPLHATQIYDLLVNGVFLFICLSVIDAKKKFDGQVTASFFILYGILRGLVEILRGDTDRGVYFGGILSTAQIFGIFSVLFGLTLYHFLRQRPLRTA